MKKIILVFLSAISFSRLQSQNLVINPDAESLPRGTGWTVISQGALTCLLIPTNNMTNWTMKPDGSVNYPLDHTTGVLGGTVFFSGCDTYLTGPFECQQTIDVSADATSIDLGVQAYTFGGFMQTPVSNQTDQGRFIVDYLNAANTVLGVSYTSNWQSEFGGSGATWHSYTNTRTAPTGTRKIRIRLQTQLIINQPAINVYFDDISLTKIAVVPVNLLSFTGKETGVSIELNWQMADAVNARQFELERSADATNFTAIGTVNAGGSRYHFLDQTNPHTADRYFYRLKMKTVDGKISYSNVMSVSTTKRISVNIAPNPARDIVTINDITVPGTVSIIDYSGKIVLQQTAVSSSVKFNVAQLASGLYMVRFSNQYNSINKRLLIRH